MMVLNGGTWGPYKWPYQSVTEFFYHPCKWSYGTLLITGKGHTWYLNWQLEPSPFEVFATVKSMCHQWISMKCMNQHQKVTGISNTEGCICWLWNHRSFHLGVMRVLQLKLLTLRTDINWSCREVFWRNSSQIKATIFHLPVVYLYIFYSSDNLRSIWSSKMLCNVQGQLILESLKNGEKKTLCRYGVDRLSELLSCCTFRWHWLPCYWNYFLRR